MQKVSLSLFGHTLLGLKLNLDAYIPAQIDWKNFTENERQAIYKEAMQQWLQETLEITVEFVE